MRVVASVRRITFPGCVSVSDEFARVPLSLHQFLRFTYALELPHCRQGPLITEGDAFVLGLHSFPLVFMRTKKEIE